MHAVTCLPENDACSVGLAHGFGFGLSSFTLCVFFYSDEAPAAPTGGMDINTALQEVLKMALTHGSLAHGLHEAAKALDKYVKTTGVVVKRVERHLAVRLKNIVGGGGL